MDPTIEELNAVFHEEETEIELLEILLENGADINSKSYYNYDPYIFTGTKLHYACFKNKIDLVIFLLKQPNINVNASDEENYKPISYSHNKYVIKLLLDAGALPDDESKESLTMNKLDYLFIHSSNITALKLLIKKGANINCLDKNNKNRLYRSVIFNSEIIRFLLDQPGIDITTKGDYPLLTQVYKLDIIKKLICLGADINEIDKNEGNSCIMNCCDDEDIVKFLVSAGADLTIKNKKGETIYDLVENKSWLYSDFYILKEEAKKLSKKNKVELLKYII